MATDQSILTISFQRNLVRENRSQGSVRGDVSNGIPYLEKETEEIETEEIEKIER